MNCKTTLGNFIFYLDNELSAEDRVKFEAHLHNCSPCYQAFAAFSSSYQIIALENSFEVSQNFYFKLKAKLSAKGSDKPFILVTRVLKPLAIAASITLGIIIGNGELQLLSTPEAEIEMAADNLTPAIPADYSIWITMNEDNGNEN
jgi:anti-sigma factor RsiW